MNASSFPHREEISHDDQEDPNVTLQGKSINAIRGFDGEDTLVEDTRTLDGNSLDWRYVNVRRTMIMLEESCRLAAKAMVFEPNVANTWVTVKSMVCNFLTGIWRRDGLAGAVPEDAFSERVVLGETMTSEDISRGHSACHCARRPQSTGRVHRDHFPAADAEVVSGGLRETWLSIRQLSLFVQGPRTVVVMPSKER